MLSAASYNNNVPGVLSQGVNPILLNPEEVYLSPLKAAQEEAEVKASIDRLAAEAASASSSGQVRVSLSKMAELGSHPAAGRLQSYINNAIKQANTVLAKCESEEIREFQETMAAATKHVINPEREKLANAISSLFTDKERAYLESIDPDKQYKVMRFDKYGNPTTEEEISGQELRDDMVLMVAHKNKDRFTPEQRKCHNQALHGNEHDASTVDELRQDRETLKKAARNVQGHRAANAKAEDAQQIGQDTKNIMDSIDKNYDLQEKQMQSKHSGKEVPLAMQAAQGAVQKDAEDEMKKALTQSLTKLVDSPSVVKKTEKTISVSHDVGVVAEVGALAPSQFTGASGSVQKLVR